MSTVETSKLLDEAGNFKVFVAGVVRDRPKLPATMSVNKRSFPAPSRVSVESGVKAPATKEPFGHVRISKFPDHFAGMDKMGFMT
jgi:hypothetical protein